jgi:hypothetical protein
MYFYLISNLIYSGVVLIISLIYINYEEKLPMELKEKLKRKGSLDTFDRYLDADDKEEKLIKNNHNPKLDSESKSNSESELDYSSPSDSKNILVKEIISQITTECHKFLISEFKLIFYFTFGFILLFYIFGDQEIALYFCLSFLAGVIISLLSVYYATTLATKNCYSILKRSK